MSRQEGKLLTCDRCGKTHFLNYYAFGNKYDKDPVNWQTYSSMGDLCPDCYKEFISLLKDFFGEENFNNSTIHYYFKLAEEYEVT